MKTSLMILALFALTYAACARLGETPAQIVARYGPMKENPEVMGTNLWNGSTNLWQGKYRHEGYDITVTFWNARSVEEQFYNFDGDIAMDVAASIFSSVSGEGKVTVTSRDYGVGGDGTLIKYLNNANGATGDLCNSGIKTGSLGIVSKEYWAFECKKLDEAQNKKLAGF